MRNQKFTHDFGILRARGGSSVYQLIVRYMMLYSPRTRR